ATGYYYSGRGPEIDPDNGRRATTSVIRAVFRMTSAGKYMLARPGSMSIAPGGDMSGGTVYARDLTFEELPGQTTMVGKAFYFSNVSPSPNPLSVIFTQSQGAERLSFPPTFPQLDAKTQDFY